MKTFLKHIRILLLRYRYIRQRDAITALRQSRQISSEGLRLMQLRTIETLRQLKQLEATSD